MKRHLGGAILGVVIMAAMSGCSAATSAGEPSPSATRLVVSLGDSLSATPPHDCAGCTSFLDLFADELLTRSGKAVMVARDAQDDTQVADVADLIERPAVRRDLAEADVVIVWIGYNDGPPYNRDTPCGSDPGDTAEQQASAIEAYTQSCVDATMALYHDRYADLFARITALSPRATSRLAINTFDNLKDNPAFPASEFPAGRMTPLLDRVVAIFDAWNTGQCSAAEASGFRCVDAYHTLNGADGRAALGEYVSDDYTHLSQKGHDTIASLLSAALS